ncbi:uncharacterized protein BO66DRAFT_255724 [Aspergillus aculeatinus CBS 121060]|uniref:Uncharacterized protein n=1 Tax=Aspergillus aculeatinus CBS 121060 TaxID=1448322 RepID=A0ACD1GRR4_9EURO|nr:hypothetical protein BO66DRAFT_255724 [Aspergillus aculeatinus CBS 121060]RAH64021.1 hypothetical protein BO66DRAFT_255724 [Aspergillus aculeatinus CBS 121060]
MRGKEKRKDQARSSTISRQNVGPPLGFREESRRMPNCDPITSVSKPLLDQDKIIVRIKPVVPTKGNQADYRRLACIHSHGVQTTMNAQSSPLARGPWRILFR